MAAESYRSAMAARLSCPTHRIPNFQLRRQASHVVVSRSSSIKPHSTSASSSRNEQSQNWKRMSRKAQRSPKPLIKVSTSDGKYYSEWTSEYALTLRELRLSDLVAQDGEKDAEVLVGFSVQKHAGFGFSIEGRVYTCFTSVCSSCFCSYRREIDKTFNVCVLPSSRSGEVGLPEIGGDDPSLCLQNPRSAFCPSIALFLIPVAVEGYGMPEVSYTTRTFSYLQVIYVKPGAEADLDSLIRDTIRLTASAKATCSEACERSTTRWQYIDGKKSYDPRWSRLLQIKRNK